MQDGNDRIASALGHLQGAKAMLHQENLAACSVHLAEAWTTLLTARELCVAEDDQRAIAAHVFATKRLLDDVDHFRSRDGVPLTVLVELEEVLSNVVGGLGDVSARVRVIALGLEVKR